MPESSPRVGLFVTCLVDMFRPSVGFAAVKLLEDAGCTVEVPEAQTCCGQPAYNSGDTADARALDAHVDREGFQLVRHSSAITDWTDRAALADIHRAEVAQLIKDLTGADEVQVNAPGILRFSEKSGKAGSTDNSPFRKSRKDWPSALMYLPSR